MRKVLGKIKAGVLREMRSRPGTSRIEYDAYTRLQWRCAPREFIDNRVKVVSSIVYVLSALGEDITKQRMTAAQGTESGAFQTRILDVGTRDGFVVSLLNTLGFADVTGIDLFADYVEYARAKGRKVIQGDVHNLPVDDASFDIVYCRHTLEHSLHPDTALRELYRVVKPGGAVYASLPMELAPQGKHTVSIPNTRIFRRMILDACPDAKPVFIGRSGRVGVIEEGAEVCALFKKP